MDQYVINSLTNIQNTYQSITAFFYQKILQTDFVNTDLANYTIDYTLLLPSSEYLEYINDGQVSAQMQSYVDLCDTLVSYINNNINLQNNILYEQIQNILDNSISQLDQFSLNLLKAQYNSLRKYPTPYNMTMSYAMYLNKISLDTWSSQISLNQTINNYNNIPAGTTLTFSL